MVALLVFLQNSLRREALYSMECITKLNKALRNTVWEVALYGLEDKYNDIEGLLFL